MEKRGKTSYSYDPAGNYVHINVLGYGPDPCAVPGCNYYYDRKVAADDHTVYRLCPRHYRRLQRMIARSSGPVKVLRFLAACEKRPLSR